MKIIGVLAYITFDQIDISPWPTLIYKLIDHVYLQNKYGAHILNSFDSITILVKLFIVPNMVQITNEEYFCYFFDKFFQVPYLSWLQNLSQIWDKSPIKGIFSLDSYFIVLNMKQITNEGYFFSGTKKKMTLIGYLSHIWNNENHWWFVSYLIQWTFFAITLIPKIVWL